jgi:hypothetical protein
MAFLTRQRRCGQVRDRRPGIPEAYSLEYAEEFLAEHDVDPLGSFSAVEILKVDRLLAQRACAFYIRHAACWIVCSDE